MSYPKARQKALAFARRDEARFAAKLSRAIDRYASNPKVHQTLMALTTGKARRFTSMSNRAVRQVVTTAVIDELLLLYSRTGRDARTRHFLFTATFDDGIVSENAPVIPLDRIKRKVRRLLRSLGLNALCMFQIDVLAKKLPGDPSRLLLVHVHAVVWTRNAKFRPRAAGRRFSGTRALRNRLGARSIDFTSRARSDRQWPDMERRHPERDQTAESMAFLGFYITAPTVAAKNRKVRRSGRVAMRSDARRFRLKTALRMAEIYSQLELPDVLFGVGEGDVLGRNVRRALAKWQKAQREPIKGLGNIDRAWARIFADNPKLGFVRAVILRDPPSLK